VPNVLTNFDFLISRGHRPPCVLLAEVLPAQVPPLADVKEKVKGEILEEKAVERSRLVATDLKTRSEKLGLEKAALALALVRKETQGLVGRGQPLGDLGDSAVVEEAAFGLAEKTLSEPVRTAGGYAVLRLLEKKPFDPAAFEKEKSGIQSSLRETKRNQFFQTFLSAARQRVSVDRNVGRVATSVRDLGCVKMDTDQRSPESYSNSASGRTALSVHR
jgi:hypothetical protein